MAELGKDNKDVAFRNALDTAVNQFVATGTVQSETAREMAYQVMTKIGVQKAGYQAVEEALKVHYGTEKKTE